jgi:hypothetical protein
MIYNNYTIKMINKQGEKSIKSVKKYYICDFAYYYIVLSLYLEPSFVWIGDIP